MKLEIFWKSREEYNDCIYIHWQSCSIGKLNVPKTESSKSFGRTSSSGVIQIKSIRAQEIIGVHLIMTAKYNFPFVFNLISILK